MKMKMVAGFIALVMVHNAYAVDKCPPNGEDCEFDPFAPVVVELARICSERQPENARYYQAAIKALLHGNEEQYNKQLSADTDAQEKLREYRKDVIAEPRARLDSECEDILAAAKEAIRQSKPRK
jgi:ElaB/YqjD/DUF883 family membrane-anchored ribosome-binding protein